MAHKRLPIQLPLQQRLGCSKQEAADLTSLGLRKIDELIKSGRLETAKVDGRTIVKVPSLFRLMNTA
jgi:excisionase family DNA binding protein